MFNLGNPDFTNHPASPRRASYPYALKSGSEAGSPPAASLITPFYETGEEFAETVACVLRQSLANFEWIVINDGSVEPAALAQLDALRALGDSRVTIVDLEQNEGVSKARNRGIERARSEVIAFLDSDDLIEPTALEKWIWFLATQPAFPFVNSHTIGFGAREYLWDEGFAQSARFLERNGANPTGAYRAEFLKEMGGYDAEITDGLEDWDFWLRTASCGHWGYTLRDPLIWYRRRDSHADRWDDFDEGERGEHFRERLRQKYPDVWRDGFPEPVFDTAANAPLREEIPFPNPLAPPAKKGGKNLLMILPHVECGGSDKFNLDLAAALTRDEGWQVSMVTTLGANGGTWLDRTAEITPDVFVLGRFLAHADYPRFISYLIESRGIDAVVLSHSVLGYQLLPYLRHRFPELPILDYLHIEMPRWKSGGYPRLSLQYGHALNLSITSSEALKGWLLERGGKEQDIEVCTTNIDTDAWDPSRVDVAAVRETYELEPDVPVILFAGRLVEQKQPRLLGPIARRLADRLGDRPFQLVVAGDGEDRHWLESYFSAHEELAPKVKLLGEISNQAIHDLLAVADIFLLPSENEGIALAIYEAMAMGCVIVGSDVGGQRELVTPETGILLPPGKQQKAADYCAALAEYLEDDDKCAAAGKAARQRVIDDFPLKSMVDQMQSLITAAGSRPVELPPADIDQIKRETVEACEQSRLEDEAGHLLRTIADLRGERRELHSKLENFRGMIARRDEKIDSLNGSLDKARRRSKTAGGGSLLGNLTRKVKRSLK